MEGLSYKMSETISNDGIRIYYREEAYRGGIAELDRITIVSDEIKHLMKMNPHDTPVYWFSRLHVHEAIRGKGVATILMDRLCKVVDDCEFIIVNAVNNYNRNMSTERLIEFYKKFGFVQTDEETFLFRLPRVKQ